MSYLNCLSVLCHSSSKSNRCMLRLLDTVFVDKNLKMSWYYTTGQSLSVAKKKDSSTSPDSVLDRFEKFALANPRNSNGIVAVFVNSEGDRQILNQSAVRDLLRNNLSELSQDGSYLQVYQRPHDQFTDRFIIQQTTVDDDGGITVSYFSLYHDGSDMGSTEPLDIGQLNKLILHDMEEFSKEIFKYIENNNKRLSAIVIEFMVDESNHAWVTNIPLANINSKVTESERRESNAHLLMKPTEVLPQVKPPSSRENQSRPSSSHNAPGPAQTIDDAKLQSSITSIFPLNSALLHKDSTGYIAKYSVDELPGLRAWVVGKANSSNDSIQWHIDMEMYHNGSVDDSHISMKNLRSKSRHVTKQKYIYLLKEAEQVLLGKLPNPITPEQLQLAWLEVYNRYLQGLVNNSHSDEEVIVCGNIFAIIPKLEGLMNSKFAYTNVVAPMLNTKHHSLSMPNITRQRQLQEEEEELKNLNRIASANSYEIDQDVRKEKLSAPASKTIQSAEIVESFRGEDSLLSNDSDHLVINEKQKRKPKKHAPDDPKTNIYENKPNAKGNKKSKGNSSFSKNSMDAPPSVDLMAKFAVQRERCVNDYLLKYLTFICIDCVVGNYWKNPYNKSQIMHQLLPKAKRKLTNKLKLQFILLMTKSYCSNSTMSLKNIL